MKIRKQYIYLFTLMAVCASLGACSGQEEEFLPSNPRTLSIVATFPGGYNASRAGVNSDDDWTYTTFNSPEDVIGFYSAYGNLDAANGNGPFDNQPFPFMTTATVNGGTRYVFNMSEANFDNSKMTASTVYSYFPYSADMAEDNGMTLRRENDGIEKCVDYLTIKNFDASGLSNGMLYGTITHEFCELIIMTGEGFEKQEEPEITVYLNNPYTNVKVTPNTNAAGNITSYTSRLLYTGSDAPADIDEARQFKAWRGQDWDGDNRAWYVVLPVTPNDIPEISYIKLKDNSGNILTVSAFTLDGTSKSLMGGKRIPLTIKNSGLQPTVFPTPIIDWDGDHDLTEERSTGIHNAVEFGQWVEAYNAYINNPSDETKQKLYSYGNFISSEGSGEGVWNFFLLNDIDLAHYSGTLRINEFKDVLDGRSDQLENSIFKNNTIAGLSSADSFIGVLSGTLQNVNLSNWSISNSTASGTYGVLANKLSGGTITGVNLDGGYIMSPGTVGLLAGDVEGGTISLSTFSGFLIGGSTDATYNSLFGTLSSAPQITESDFIDIVFTNYNL